MFIITGTSYYIKIKRVKRAIKKELAAGNMDDAHVVVFSSLQIQGAEWVEAKEFRWNNHMYDVFKTDTCGQEIIYYTFLDNEETTWANLFIEHCKNQSPVSASKDTNPLKVLMKDLWMENDAHLLTIKNDITNILLFFDNKCYFNIPLHQHTPPPETIV